MSIPLFSLAQTFIISAAGGVLFYVAGLPAPWLAGAMFGAAIGAIFGLQIGIPDSLKTLMFVLLGLQIGSGVTAEAFEHLSKWPLSVMMLAFAVFAVNAGGYYFYRRIYGWSGPDAFFASSPGALSLVLAMANDYRADLQRVTVVQCLRLFFLVAILPIAVTSQGLVPEVAVVPISGANDNPPVWIVTLIVLAGLLAGLLFERFRVPAGMLLGAASVNAALHLTGTVSGRVPDWLLIPAFILLGAMIGGRFSGFTLATLRRLSVAGVTGFVVALATSVVCAIITVWLTELDFTTVLLAFAPGGLEVMTIMAFALDLDVTYVAAHQVARYFLLVLFLPMILPVISRHWSSQNSSPR